MDKQQIISILEELGALRLNSPSTKTSSLGFIGEGGRNVDELQADDDVEQMVPVTIKKEKDSVWCPWWEAVNKESTDDDDPGNTIGGKNNDDGADLDVDQIATEKCNETATNSNKNSIFSKNDRDKDPIKSICDATDKRHQRSPPPSTAMLHDNNSLKTQSTGNSHDISNPCQDSNRHKHYKQLKFILIHSYTFIHFYRLHLGHLDNDHWLLIKRLCLECKSGGFMSNDLDEDGNQETHPLTAIFVLVESMITMNSENFISVERRLQSLKDLLQIFSNNVHACRLLELLHSNDIIIVDESADCGLWWRGCKCLQSAILARISQIQTPSF